jgi:hypothetical protein
MVYLVLGIPTLGIAGNLLVVIGIVFTILGTINN